VAAVALVALILVSLQSAAPTANAQILPPSGFYGTVTVDGTAATAGTLRGKVGGNICGTASIDPGLGGGLNYTIQVKHSSDQAGCGSDGATVVFEFVDGGAAIACTPNGTWNSANVQLLNLTCTTPPTPTATATATPTPTATAVPTPTATATATATATVTPTVVVLPGTGGNADSGSSLPLGLLLAGMLGLAVVGSGAWALSRTRRPSH